MAILLRLTCIPNDSIGNLIASEKKDAAGNCVMRIYQNYDASGQLVGQSVYLGDSNYAQNYTYTDNGYFASMSTGTGDTLSFTYDELNRLSKVQDSRYSKDYTYFNKNSMYTTEQIAQLQYTGLTTTLTYAYTYDNVGNIATYTAPGKSAVVYTYDTQGQLLSAVGNETYTYTYDGVGNILTANGHTYTYGNTQWRDLLTAYDGETITYDASGNPLSYYNGTRWTFTWENGRSLATANDGITSISYAYDAEGLRTAKVVNGVTHNYLYASGQLLRETYGNNTLDFFYDANGYPYALKYNGTTYYYITNLQGDVMYLIDANENTVASYEYDPYGNIVSATGTMAEINPLRYRGYYYDAELEMYYLQSRYYDPQICRFINADTFASTGQGVLGCNMFAYCVNNPISLSDPYGSSSLLPYLTLWDYQRIHSMVQTHVQIKKGWATEVGVRTDRKNGYKTGRLDLFDPDTNTYYEVKSIGAAYTPATVKQMNRYDISKIYGVWSWVYSQRTAAKRGTEYVSGSFTYGMWDVKYSLQAPGLIVYTPTYNWGRASITAVAVIALAAIGIYFAGAGAFVLLPA